MSEDRGAVIANLEALGLVDDGAVTPKGFAVWIEGALPCSCSVDPDSPSDDGVLWIEHGDRLYLVRVTEVPS